MLKSPSITVVAGGVLVVGASIWIVAGSPSAAGQSENEQRAFHERFWHYLTQQDPYTEWSQWPGRDGLYESTSERHGAYLRTFVNHTAARDPETLPHNAVIVKENFMEDDPETLAAVTVMYRSDGYDPDHYDWYWVKYLPDGSVDRTPDGNLMAGRVPGCIQCHSQAEGGDFVFANDGGVPDLATSDDGDGQDGEAAATVRMTDDLTFDPANLTIRAGESVRWTNPSSVFHTVTADPALAAEPNDVLLPEGAEPFDSGRIDPGETYTRTFTVPGRYRYFCIPHELQGMIGELTVEE